MELERPVGAAVHCWSAPLDVPPEEGGRLAALLAPDERARAGRFRFPRDRDRYCAGRGTLRALLGAYTGTPPESLRFDYGPYGKPRLAEPGGSPGGAPGLTFNLGHAGGLALYAFASGREVGVDVEARRALPDLDAVARGVMTGAEYATFSALAPDARVSAFFALWTRKEAHLKATGAGFSRAPQTFSVDGLRAAGWTLADLDPAPGFAACVAALGPVDPLRCRRWAAGRPSPATV